MKTLGDVARKHLSGHDDIYDAYEVAARLHIRKWAAEMNRGSGQDNVLNWFNQVRDRQSGAWPGGPGPGFSPAAERTDRALRVVRTMKPEFAVTLMAWAFDISLAPNGTKEELAEAKHQLDLGFAAFGGAFELARSLQSYGVRS